jgi:hypothetical protein
MSDIDLRLQKALKAGDPAVRDPMFRVQVLLRRERAAFRRKVVTASVLALGFAILATLGLGAFGDRISPLWLALGATVAVAAPIVLAAGSSGLFGARAASVLRSAAAPLLWR